MPARILLIDDDAGIRESMRMPLEYEGYDYLSAGTADEGIALVQRESPDIVQQSAVSPTKKAVAQRNMAQFQRRGRHGSFERESYGDWGRGVRQHSEEARLHREGMFAIARLTEPAL